MLDARCSMQAVSDAELTPGKLGQMIRKGAPGLDRAVLCRRDPLGKHVESTATGEDLP